VRLEQLGGAVNGVVGEGAAEVVLSERSWRGKGLELSIGKGEIRLRVPPVYHAELTASAGGGEIEVRYPLSEPEQRDPQSLRANLGTGGAPINLTSTAGTVRVLPLSDAP
jgi:hypothetical protein